MKMLARLFKSNSPRRHTKYHDEASFLKLYSVWQETHDLSLRKRLFSRLSVVMRRTPNFDLRRRFEQAF